MNLFYLDSSVFGEDYYLNCFCNLLEIKNLQLLEGAENIYL